jgi:FHA domain/Zinc-ribbon containing domain
MTATGQTPEDVQEAGLPAGAGSFSCLACSFPISLDHSEEMPRCPNCGGSRFRRASLFEQPTLQGFTAVASPQASAEWLEQTRDSIEAAGKYLAMHAEGRTHVFEIGQGWTRIGRSRTADIRLDDPTVSRRHAVVVRTPEGDLSALDDRSTNGILVNRGAVDFSALADGDQLQIGRYTLHVIETAGAGRAGPD